ncbi:hypothetical protein N9X07_04150 [Flavobacteriaceae bacterium]|nr:hypothetical protein [Flavobacteriaceae bacterium]
MEIVIHGTKDGYRQLHSTNADIAYVIAKDMRIGTNDDGSLGESLYSLGFFTRGLAYSKYIIVKDTQRSSALGFIAFTLFLEHNKTLEGSNIKKLLDELSESYSKKYILNNYLNRGEKSLIREDWSFVKNISDNYNEQSRIINYQQKTGSKDPALVYFKETQDLPRHFDRPYQEEYENFKQIFFLASNQKARNTNPTNVLRNSGQELNINLNNKYYKILNLNPSSRVRIRVNNKSIATNYLIRDNSDLEISYSKNDQLYERIEEKGRLQDDRIKKYLSKEGNGIRINYEAFTTQIPKTKTIIIEPKKEGVTYFNPDLKLICKVSGYTSDTLPVINNEIVFKGEQINTKWEIKATGLTSFEEAKSIDITPLLTNSPVVFNISTKKQTTAPPKKYFYDTGNHGSLKQGAADYSLNKEGDSTIIKPNRGYEFTGWEFNNSKRTLVAQYEKSNKYKLILIGKSFIAFCLIFIIIQLTVELIDYNSTKIEQIPDYHIMTDYADGDELFLNQLYEFKRDLDDNKPITSDDNWFSKLFGKKLDTTNNKSWDRTYLLLKRAIIRRTKIDKKKFNEIDLSKFSRNQEGFVNAVKEIKTDTLNYEKVVEDLGDVSSMGLNNIKDTISDILEKINSQKEEDTKNAEKEAQIAKAKEEAKKQQQKQEQQNKKENEKREALRKQLKRDDITKDELNNLLKKYPEFKSQIKQYLKFFEIATKKDFDVFKDFKKSLTNNKNKDYFKDTPLLEFIKEICKEDNGESSNFLVYKSLKGRTTITSLKELIEKYNKKNN